MFPKCKANEQRRKKACLRLKHHSPRSIVLLHVQVLAAISAFITLNGPCAGDINKSGFSTRKAKLHDDHFSTNTNYIAKFAVLLASTFSCTDKWCPLWISSNKSVTTSFFLLLSTNTSLLPFARSKIYNRSLWRTRDPFDESVHYKNLSTCIKVLVHEMNKGNNPRKKRTASANATWKERLQKLSI